MTSTLPQIDFTDQRLDNGLRLIVAPDPLTPIAAVNLWYDVGSRDEAPGQTGVAHLFEHMMFQGSANVAKGEHFKMVELAGGSCNATTWLHRTNYFEYAPSHQLEMLLWLEADRMGGLLDALTQETLDNQRDVVKNEKRQSYDDRPYGSWWERIAGSLFPEQHPYQHTTIGSMEDLSAATLEDIRAFFTTYYAPNNCVLTVAGDVAPDDVRTLVERYFGGIPANAASPPRRDPAAPLKRGGSHREVVKDKVPLSRVYVGYRAPAAGKPESDALAMATVLLSGGGSSGEGGRLHRRLVRGRGLAQDAEFFTQDFQGVSFAGGWATARPDADIDELASAFDDAIASLWTEPISDDEVLRARASVERGEIEGRFLRVASRADMLSEQATMFGDPGRANRYLGDLLAVEPERMAAIAREVLDPDERVVFVFEPEDA